MLTSGFRTHWRVRLTVLVVACGLAAALRHAPAPVAHQLLIAGAAAFAFAHLVAVPARMRLGHWGVAGIGPQLALEALVGIGLPLAMIAALRAWPSSLVLQVVIGGLLFVVHGLYVKLQRVLGQEVREADLETIADWVARHRIDWIVGDRRRIREVPDRSREPHGLMRLLSFLTAPGDWGLSGMRLVALWMIMTGLWLTADAGASQLIHAWIHPESTIGNGRGGESGDSAGVAGAGSAENATPRKEVGGTNTLGQSPGPSFCINEIPPGAPNWARADLGELYYGGLGGRATKAPGFRIGGCPGRAHVPSALEGRFVWAVGRDQSGEIRSLVVDSLEYGPEIFIAPAAQRVLAMIGNGLEPLGGEPRFSVAGGDVVTVNSRHGTVALVRSEEHLPGEPQLAAPYVELPPTVATAWLGAMGERRIWLWPMSPRHEKGEEIYGLAARSGGQPLYEVVYDPATGEARRDQYDYSLPETPLGYDELKAWAASLPGG